MPKIALMTLDKAQLAPLPDDVSGTAGAHAYFAGDKHPLHLHLIDLAPGERLRIGGGAVDRLAYVWHGAVAAGGRAMPAGSSLVVEPGREVEIVGGAEPAQLLTFASGHVPMRPRPGGHVHLLPVERVARDETLGGASGVRGGMHFDSSLDSCDVWLHENHFPGMAPLSPEDEKRGVHSHSEDEIIFVTGGEIRLGAKLHGPGTALAIAADTLYSFTAGPEGLSFINFRAGEPGDIQFASGAAISETGYWRERVTRPEYLEVA